MNTNRRFSDTVMNNSASLMFLTLGGNLSTWSKPTHWQHTDILAVTCHVGFTGTKVTPLAPMAFFQPVEETAVWSSIGVTTVDCGHHDSFGMFFLSDAFPEANLTYNAPFCASLASWCFLLASEKAKATESRLV